MTVYSLGTCGCSEVRVTHALLVRVAHQVLLQNELPGRLVVLLGAFRGGWASVS